MLPRTRDLVGLWKETLIRGNRVTFTVRGPSMAPLIRDGDSIQIESVGLDELRAGDLLLFTTEEGDPIVHRLIKCEDTPAGLSLVTKGDSTRTVDRAISPGQVVGRVVEVRRGDRVWFQRGNSMIWLNSILARLSPHRRSIGKLVRFLRLDRLSHWIQNRLIG